MMDQQPEDPHMIKTHREINILLNEVKSVEHNFKDLDIFKNLPIDTTFELKEPIQKEEIGEYNNEIKQITGKPEIAEKLSQPEIIRQKSPIEEFKPIKKVSYNLTTRLLMPILKTPDVGHTTFTLQMKDGNLIGFHKPPETTKELKEFIPIIKQNITGIPAYLKNINKQIKENGIKKEIKKITTKIITPIKTIKIQSIKNIPNKIRNLLSSD